MELLVQVEGHPEYNSSYTLIYRTLKDENQVMNNQDQFINFNKSDP